MIFRPQIYCISVYVVCNVLYIYKNKTFFSYSPHQEPIFAFWEVSWPKLGMDERQEAGSQRCGDLGLCPQGSAVWQN